MTFYEDRYKALLRRITEIADMRPRPAAKALAAVVYAHNMEASSRPGPPAPDPEKVRQAWNLRQRGWSLQEICGELGISKSTASRWVNKDGAPIKPETVSRKREPETVSPKRGCPAPDPEKVRKALDLRQRGWLLRNISDELDVPTSTVQRWVTR